MSMEVSSNYERSVANTACNVQGYQNEYMERIQEGKDKAEEVGKEGIPVPKDEYISDGKSGSRPSGLYRMGQDENGNPKVLYDDPKKSSGAEGKGEPKVKSGSRKEDAEEVTCNTDAVDREIEKLKKQKQQLEQQIKAASGDEKKVEGLEKKLAQVESELSQKDNDTYRRQNAVISYGIR